MPNNPTTEADVFLSLHIIPPPGRTSFDAKQRIVTWVKIANNPSLKAPNADAKTLANVRRKAVQNVRRLVARHPEAAALAGAELRMGVYQ